jgi:repressor of nif and glnA expression
VRSNLLLFAADGTESLSRQRYPNPSHDIGRRTLRDKVHQQGLALTERAIRKRLRALRADGLIDWGLGRTGVCLTVKGRGATAGR